MHAVVNDDPVNFVPLLPCDCFDCRVCTYTQMFINLCLLSIAVRVTVVTASPSRRNVIMFEFEEWT